MFFLKDEILKFLSFFRFLLFIILIFLFPVSSFGKANFNEIVLQVSKEAEQKGISSKVINEFKNKTKFIKRVIELDKSQPEFKLTLDQYLKRIVTPTRIKKANQKYNENKKLLTQISKHYGVQSRFLVALWGIETDFGRLTGGFSVISALTTLVYDGRRYDYFKRCWDKFKPIYYYAGNYYVIEEINYTIKHFTINIFYKNRNFEFSCQCAVKSIN